MQRPCMHERNGRQSNPARVALLGLCHRRGRVGKHTLLRWDALGRVCIGSLSPAALLPFAPRELVRIAEAAEIRRERELAKENVFTAVNMPVANVLLGCSYNSQLSIFT